MADRGHFDTAVSIQVIDHDQRRVEHSGHSLADAKVRLVETVLETHESHFAAVGGRRGLAALSGCNLQTGDIGEQLADTGVSTEVVFVAPETDRVTRPAVDHVRIDPPGPRR